MEIISNFLCQILFSVGIIAVFGLLLSLCRKAFCKIVGDNGTKILLVTGVVGTPIHELSHAFMCLIFGHKIEEIKLYQPDSKDGTLGFVKHSFNPKNIYQQIGNFFIGIAPILFGSAILYLVMFLLVPETYSEVTEELQFVGLLSIDFFDLTTYAGLLDLFWGIITIIFDFTNSGNILWWLFIVLSFMISSHMELSSADIKGGLKGLIFVSIILLVVDIVLYFVSNSTLEVLTVNMTSFAITITCFLAISGVFAGVMVIFGMMIKGLIKLLKK